MTWRQGCDQIQAARRAAKTRSPQRNAPRESPEDQKAGKQKAKQQSEQPHLAHGEQQTRHDGVDPVKHPERTKKATQDPKSSNYHTAKSTMQSHEGPEAAQETRCTLSG